MKKQAQQPKRYFNNWNYRKHAKLCACIYIPLFFIDMTLGYILVKKLIDTHTKPQQVDRINEGSKQRNL